MEASGRQSNGVPLLGKCWGFEDVLFNGKGSDLPLTRLRNNSVEIGGVTSVKNSPWKQAAEVHKVRLTWCYASSWPLCKGRKFLSGRTGRADGFEVT